MHGVFPDRLDQQKVVNAILNCFAVVFSGMFVQIVVARTPPVVDIRVGTAFTLPPIVALDAPDSLFLEFIHVQDEK